MQELCIDFLLKLQIDKFVTIRFPEGWHHLHIYYISSVCTVFLLMRLSSHLDLRNNLLIIQDDIYKILLLVEESFRRKKLLLS